MNAEPLPSTNDSALNNILPAIVEPLGEFSYYDQSTGKYLIRDNRGVWINITVQDLRRHLKECGFADKLGDTTTVDFELNRIQRELCVDYAGSLAGYEEGIIEQGGCRILVKDSPKLILPVEGKWPSPFPAPAQSVPATVRTNLRDHKAQRSRWVGGFETPARYLRTVDRSNPSSRAIRRLDHPCTCRATMLCC